MVDGVDGVDGEDGADSGQREALRPVAALPAFYLEDGPGDASGEEPAAGEPGGRPGAPFVLRAAEEAHALRVLRLQPGDPLLGLDGRGRSWRLRVERVTRKRLLLAAEGEPEVEPEPGGEGSRLPWIELAIAWPKKARGEAMLGPLAQLGAAAVTPLAARFRGPEPCPRQPTERWERLVREASKQCGRKWLPELRPGTDCETLAEAARDAALAILEPRGGMSLDTWLRSLHRSPMGLGTRARPIVLAIGPEGGFAPEEREALLLAGGTTCRLGPSVLRVETAAQAALAVAVAVLSY